MTETIPSEHQQDAPVDRDGYPVNAVWKCEGFWLAPDRGWGILGHRAVGDTAVLGPRLLRLLSADLARLADDLEGVEPQKREEEVPYDRDFAGPVL